MIPVETFFSANAKRQIEGSAEKSSDDISTLHALAMVSSFLFVSPSS